MSFAKAVNRTSMPEFQEYCTELLLYKRAQSSHALFMQRFRELENSSDVLERARFYDEKKAFSQSCKKYYAARKSYEAAVARSEIKERGIKTLTDADILRLAQIQVPMALKDLIELERKERVAASFTQKEFEMVKEAQKLRKDQFRAKATLSLLDGFISSETRNDPTFEDFEDLPLPQAAPGDETVMVDADANADTSVEFDPEFDKL